MNRIEYLVFSKEIGQSFASALLGLKRVTALAATTLVVLSVGTGCWVTEGSSDVTEPESAPPISSAIDSGVDDTLIVGSDVSPAQFAEICDEANRYAAARVTDGALCRFFAYQDTLYNTESFSASYCEDVLTFCLLHPEQDTDVVEAKRSLSTPCDAYNPNSESCSIEVGDFEERSAQEIDAWISQWSSFDCTQPLLSDWDEYAWSHDEEDIYSCYCTSPGGVPLY